METKAEKRARKEALKAKLAEVDVEITLLDFLKERKWFVIGAVGFILLMCVLSVV